MRYKYRSHSNLIYKLTNYLKLSYKSLNRGFNSKSKLSFYLGSVPQVPRYDTVGRYIGNVTTGIHKFLVKMSIRISNCYIKSGTTVYVATACAQHAFLPTYLLILKKKLNLNSVSNCSKILQKEASKYTFMKQALEVNPTSEKVQEELSSIGM